MLFVFPALEIFPFDHCLPGNLGAFKVFRDLHWHSFAFCISPSLANSWQDKFFLITKGHQGLVTFYGHPCNITACNCSPMWNVEAIKIAEGETGLTKNKMGVWWMLKVLTQSSQSPQCSSDVVLSSTGEGSLQPAAAGIPTHCGDTTATAGVQHQSQSASAWAKPAFLLLWWGKEVFQLHVLLWVLIAVNPSTVWASAGR